MCSKTHHLLIFCIIFFHLSPQLTFWNQSNHCKLQIHNHSQPNNEDINLFKKNENSQSFIFKILSANLDYFSNKWSFDRFVVGAEAVPQDTKAGHRKLIFFFFF